MSEHDAFTAALPNNANVEGLITDNKLLRILQPALKAQVELSKKQGKSVSCVVEHQGRLYISLSQVEDDVQRKYFYQVIQQHQMGLPVNLDELPPAIQELLQPELTQAGRALGAVMLGAVAGIAVGILAMALTVLIVNSITWLTHRSAVQFAGIELTAVSFIIFTFVGWAAAGLLAWHKPHLWAKLTGATDILYRR